MWFTKLMSKEESMIGNLLSFFKTDKHFSILYDLIKNEKSRKNKMSLRLIYWFVTNYAKHYTTMYPIPKKYIVPYIYSNSTVQKNITEAFLVWIEYEKELASEGKEYFDIFRRGAHVGKLIELEYDADKKLQTTIAQLNFFRWAIRKDIITYVSNNVEIIYKDMIERSSSLKNRVQNPDGTIKKRQLSECISKKLGCHNISLALKVSIKTEAGDMTLIL